jgi:hypothetical protein
MIRTDEVSEELADALVDVFFSEADGHYFLALRGLLPEPVYIGPLHNGVVAQYQADRVKQFIAALVRRLPASMGAETENEWKRVPEQPPKNASSSSPRKPR